MDAQCKNDILVRLVPKGVASRVLSNADADKAMAASWCVWVMEFLVGKGIEVAFDFDGKPEWVHGEIIEVKAADKIRVLYYDDRHRIWHSRFKMPQYDKKKSPIEHSGKKSLSDYHWRLVS